MASKNGTVGLGELRTKIDAVDTKLIRLLSERFRLTEQVGLYKKKNQLPAYDRIREIQIAERRKRMCESEGFDPETGKAVFQRILQLVRKRHREIRDS
ncbi:MAG: chorismate mutase [Candidatus Moranbacteria bacterium]|nr:chorismate mutase [Candidatus Moranbacteria bacterium]